MDPAVPGAFGAIEDGAIGIQDGRIVRVGRRVELAGYRAQQGRAARRRLGHARAGRLPHPSRLRRQSRREWEMRLNGASYEEIARAGGGIAATVEATRAATEEELVAQSRPRLQAMCAAACTTVEIKSGYGLDIESEMKMLARRARRSARARRCGSCRTLLALHALPPEHRDSRADLCRPDVRRDDPRRRRGRLASAVDAFCETIAFTPEEDGRLFEAAAAHGLRVKLHAEQLSNLARRGAGGRIRTRCPPIISNMSTRRASRRWRRPGWSRCCCPAPSISCARRSKPPIDLLRRAGVPMAMATDCNPGTSPVSVADPDAQHGLHPVRPDARGGAGRHDRARREGAGPRDEIGTISAGKAADLCVWRVSVRPSFATGSAPGPERRIVAGEDANV